ncbi:MAG TPA: hypothetical protein VN777_12295 [Terriglobales bacterium]|nr:hypothetical protein [Terriglobales bacterium]
MKSRMMMRIAKIGLFTLLGLSPLAWGSWGNFISTGNATGIGNPSCAPVSTAHVACAVRSSKSAIMVNEFNGTAWGTWKILPGTVSSDPSCTNDGAGKVYCAATATNGDLQVTVFSSGVWSNPTKVTGALYSAPSCAQYTTGKVLCAARSASGGLAWSVYNGTDWSTFAKLTTPATSAPSCTTDNNNGVICMVYTTGYATLVNRYAAGAWEGFLNIVGVAGGEPDCTSMNSDGNVACFVQGAASLGIFGTRFDGGGWNLNDWSGYGGGLGGEVSENAGCTSQAAGELVCAVYGVGVAYNSALFSDVFNGSGWSGWTLVGGAGIGTPACSPLGTGTGQVVCVVMGINNKLTSVVGP